MSASCYVLDMRYQAPPLLDDHHAGTGTGLGNRDQAGRCRLCEDDALGSHADLQDQLFP
jgi:hypothetical protein